MQQLRADRPAGTRRRGERTAARPDAQDEGAAVGQELARPVVEVRRERWADPPGVVGRVDASLAPVADGEQQPAVGLTASSTARVGDRASRRGEGSAISQRISSPSRIAASRRPPGSEARSRSRGGGERAAVELAPPAGRGVPADDRAVERAECTPCGRRPRRPVRGRCSRARGWDAPSSGRRPAARGFQSWA